jgi:ATP-dependent Clp protease ATP-binding subunit ClpA
MRKYFEASFLVENCALLVQPWTNTKSISKRQSTRKTFQEIIIEEPDTERDFNLRGIKEKYETHHKVQIKDEAIIAAVELSQRYIIVSSGQS